MKDTISSALEKVGINKKEGKLYIELLTIGTQPASVLARKLGLPRSSVQFLAESLVKKGIVSKHKHKNITKYQPAPPENLLRILEKEKSMYLSELETKQLRLKDVVPELQKLQSQEIKRPQVGFYEGVEGVKAIYEDTLHAKETVRTLANYEERNKHLKEYFQDYYTRRKQQKVFVKAIYPNTPFGKLRQARDIEDYRESKLIDAKKYKWLPEIQFYDNKVAISSANERIGVLIESDEIAQGMKVLFDLAWKGAEAEQQKKK
jgi:sugar-specific transcriptional regulator TrmB